MFYADLHVHSKFSRATSKDCDLEHLALWAARKGIRVVATGDFTHPGWMKEIQEKLLPAEPGLFRLRPELVRQVENDLGGHGAGDVRFLLEVEISTIYKRDGRTRKVHHLLYAPDLPSAQRIIASLTRIGNLNSDGRPILGLDSRSLLEITLESGEGCWLAPAHIWTPWFAVLGSQSGFDSIEHCYGDLSGEIFALETGLSSDPPMNWLVSSLDRYALVSNSDAHSPPKLGREACVFDTELDYFAMRRALATGQGYRGTIEFFPEEGKYHLDGHRKCGVCLEPEQSREHGGKCPVCGKPLTLGVMHRVCELADRSEVPAPRPPRAAEFRSLIPLDEVLSEILGVGPQSNQVRQKYLELTSRLGPELFLLEQIAPEDVARAGSPLLAEALTRMRRGDVIRQAGYDGEYGVIRLFAEHERPARGGKRTLFEDETESPRAGDCPGLRAAKPGLSPSISGPRAAKPQAEAEPSPVDLLDQLDPGQRAAAVAVSGPVLIVAGPGTGKTRTLTHRLAHLIVDQGVPPEQCLAITFSRRAADEMHQRLERLLPDQAPRVAVMTFHALGLSILHEQSDRLGLGDSLRVASPAERGQLLEQSLGVSSHAARVLLERISRRKRSESCPMQPKEEEAFATYVQQMRARAWLDFDDLVLLPVELLAAHADLVEHYRSRYRWVSVDEYQDIDPAQYQLLRLLSPADGNLCAIGDPDQAIYGFRGADVGFFQRFAADFPSAQTVVLGRNYRSTQTIVDAALQLIAPATLLADRQLEAGADGPERIEIHACTTDRAEAEFVVHTIERMLGGSTFFSLDSGRAEAYEAESLSLADVAVLYRTEAQADLVAEALARSGMPFQRRSHQPLVDRPEVRSLVEALDSTPAGSVLEQVDDAAAKLVESAPELGPVLPALRALAARCGADRAMFLSELALGVDTDLWDPRADRVSLLTLHAAKGLEFPVVFITGCEDGLTPLRFGQADEASLAEERRLFFVGMTRAARRLILTHARRRFWRGQVRPMERSPFLDDIETRLLAQHEHRSEKRPQVVDRQRTLFD